MFSPIKLLVPCLLVVLMGCSVFGPVESRITGHIPYAAKTLANSIDEQLMMRFAKEDSKEQSPANVRAAILVMGTTAVNVNNLLQTCPLSRQMTEELSSRLIDMGYRYEELRMGRDIRFDRAAGGELILTRNVRQLKTPYGFGQAVIAGTYVISDTHVRFTYSILRPETNEVIAKALATVPITDDILPLLDESPLTGSQRRAHSPNTFTRLR
ncbi:MAG: hypothetical protein IJS54_05325 [Desulfovibrio sp.]|nr:hypothetical protein [Desulfovibrio sp.]